MQTSHLTAILIEDDPDLARAIQAGLGDEGIAVQWFDQTTSARSACMRPDTDVIILDRMLPGQNGMEFLKSLRDQRMTIPVILLTALGTVEDRVTGLREGADDYLVKPFSMRELTARIQALSRRSQRIEGPLLTYGPLRLELTTRRAFREGKELGLSPTELTLLELFMRRPEQVLTRGMLCEQLWDSSWDGETNVIEVHINRLRGKIDRPFAFPLIHTVRGKGYTLTESPPS